MQPLQSTSCPNCITVRKSQGFSVIIDDTQPLCDSCAKWKADDDYFKSEAYVTWMASMPQGLTLEEMTEWVKSHPPPPRI